ncbi:GAF domain-containing protein [Granulicoccus phenolivorans]|uniref:GAF domain-containing protein n=1 Tax=Granulicoccus phenolivorans TaxID=266854 RepID=UPI0005559F65|nr:GAF domain-containing protein [Granulicoccus phenolivorans]
MVPPTMRAEVADSWRRSVAAGVRPDSGEPPIGVTPDEIQDRRQGHPLASVQPLLTEVLGPAAEDCGAMLAIFDQTGSMLWAYGPNAARRRVEAIGFVEGTRWDEPAVGTSAPGLALLLQRPVSVSGAEHFRESVQRVNCVAAPIRDPRTGLVLGVLDITGGSNVAEPQTLAMIRAAARMAESELVQHLTATFAGPVTPVPPVTLRTSVTLRTLGRAQAELTLGSGPQARVVPLTQRHSDIVALLARCGSGLSGDELSVLLSEEELAESTTRAELQRLRRLIGKDLLASRPYRLTAEVRADWVEVEECLARGDLARALAAYAGPLLPRSTAPGVVALRDELAEALRRALLTSGDAGLLGTWTRSSWGADDYPLVRAHLAALPRNSPMRPLAESQLHRLDRELR